MSVRQDEPFEIQPRANGAMARALKAATFAALVLGLVGAVAPASVGDPAAWAGFGVIVAVPLARIAWLGFRWIQRRDFRYAVIAFGLLAVVLLGAVGAYLQAG
ncbi:hypothetical protein BH24ACT15_BH24ACT15_30290 [soil metagenome]